MPREDGYKNLIPVKKGEASRNPAGRKKGSINFKRIIRKILEHKIELTDPITLSKKEAQIADHISFKLVAMALEGDLKAIEIIMDRVNGKVAQKSKSEIKDVTPISITQERYDTAMRAAKRLIEGASVQ